MVEAAADDPAFAEAWDSLQTFRARNATWRRLASP
jgi:TRAP-type mannitol/chloroaromatic compound transport system substrate-binding protein